MKNFMRGAIEGFADNYGVEIERLEADGDHVHILFKAKPSTDLTKFINTLKGSTARRIRNEFHDEIKRKLWGDSFWTDSYCLISTGQVSLDTLIEYVDSQREEPPEDR
jgi:putative transposase